MTTRLYALAGVLVFLGLMWLYTREFAYFSNTIGIKTLLWGSFAVGLALSGGALYLKRDRFSPVSRHYPELIFIMVMSALFAPLFGSLLNRTLGTKTFSEFKFISETAYIATGYGLIKDEAIKPTGWVLTVNDNNTVRQFRYKKQAYYPISQPGDIISLPVTRGLFGVKVIDLH